MLWDLSLWESHANLCPITPGDILHCYALVVCAPHHTHTVLPARSLDANSMLGPRRTIINSCPALKSFKPAPWAPRGHSQTIWGAFVTTQDNYVYEREMVIMVDRVKVALDWCHPKGSAPVSEDAPIVLCLHGIGECCGENSEEATG